MLKWFSFYLFYTHFFSKQLGPGISPQSCLYFQGFQGYDEFNNFQDSKFIFMVSDFKILKSQWCFWNSWIVVYCSFNNYFMFITKEKLHCSLIYIFYCGLVKKRWALKVAVQFAVRGLVAYNPIAYKKNKCISLHIMLNIYF